METSPIATARPFLVQTDAMSPEQGFTLPAGIVTFLLTDVEGSTKLWHERPAEMPETITRHYSILDEVIAEAGGVRPVEQGEGDSIVAAFARATDALGAALAAQRRLTFELPWLPVRMAVHTGEAQLRDEGNYVGRTIIRCARLRACGHGGQVLVSETTAALSGDDMPDGAELIELGLARLRDLSRSERVFQLGHTDLSRQFPPLRSLDAAPHNLPTPLTSFVGREQELAALARLIDEHRLVTLAGPGGCGKTRVALHSAADAVGLHPGGTWWVELAPISVGEHVAERVAGAVGFSLVGGVDPAAQIVRYLRDVEPTLVVLDNAEHVIDATAQLAASLLAGCPNVRVLVTSREPLGVPGEYVWRVPSLSLPSADTPTAIEKLETFDAVRLFLDRARHSRPNLVIDATNAAHVAAICIRLDGIPLALELAAARARSLPLDRLSAGLDDSFRLLTGGARTLMARQQTLLASIAWSHDLLDESERAVLRRLAVFAGSFTLDAAEGVAADGQVVDSIDVLDTLGRLVDKSLVQLDDSTGRYRLLETIRQFAVDRLREAGELESVWSRHAEYFAEVCHRWRAGAYGIDRSVLVPLMADLVAAERWARDRMPVIAYRMIADLTDARLSLGYLTEITAAYEWIVSSQAGDHPVEWAAAAASAAVWSFPLQRFEMLGRMDEIAGYLTDDDRSRRARGSLAYARAWLGGAQGVLDPFSDLVAQLIAEGDDSGTVIVAGTAALVGSMTGSFDDADRYATIAEQTLARHGLAFTPDTAASAFAGRAIALTHRGRPREAREMFLALRTPADSYFTFISACALAMTAQALGDAHLAATAVKWVDREATPVHRGLAAATRAIDAAIAERWDDVLDHLSPYLKPGEFMMPLARGIVATALAQALAAKGRAHEAAQLGHFGTDLDPSGALIGVVTSIHNALVALALGVDAADSAHEALEAASNCAADLSTLHAIELVAVAALRRGNAATAHRLLGACATVRQDRGIASSYLIGWYPIDELTASAQNTPEFAEGRNLSLAGAVEYAQRMRGERGRPTHGWVSLTPTERKVADLIATGRTNQQIATELLMGIATVKTHVTHIFDKLGVTNRAAVASAATSRTQPNRP